MHVQMFKRVYKGEFREPTEKKKTGAGHGARGKDGNLNRPVTGFNMQACGGAQSLLVDMAA